MTKDEEMAARARMMDEFVEKKADLAKFKDAAYFIGSRLMDIGKTLCGNPSEIDLSDQPYPYLNVSFLMKVANDYGSTAKRMSELKQNLIAVGWIEKEGPSLPDEPHF